MKQGLSSLVIHKQLLHIAFRLNYPRGKKYHQVKLPVLIALEPEEVSNQRNISEQRCFVVKHLFSVLNQPTYNEGLPIFDYNRRIGTSCRSRNAELGGVKSRGRLSGRGNLGLSIV